MLVTNHFAAPQYELSHVPAGAPAANAVVPEPVAVAAETVTALEPVQSPAPIKLTKQALQKNFNIHSIQPFLGSSKELSVFGYDTCFYIEIGFLIDKNKELIGLERVFQPDILGDSSYNEDIYYLNWADRPEDKRGKRLFKTAITNVILENYARARTQTPPITILFLIDRDHNPIAFDPAAIASKAPMITRNGKEIYLNSSITHSELRRMAKLVELGELEPSVEEKQPDIEIQDGEAISNEKMLREIGQIAKRDIKFAKVCIDDQGQVYLKECPPFYLSKEWKKGKQDRCQFRKLQEQFEMKMRESMKMGAEAERLLKSLHEIQNEETKEKIRICAEQLKEQDRMVTKEAYAFFDTHIAHVNEDRRHAYRQTKKLEDQWLHQLVEGAKELIAQIELIAQVEEKRAKKVEGSEVEADEADEPSGSDGESVAYQAPPSREIAGDSDEATKWMYNPLDEADDN